MTFSNYITNKTISRPKMVTEKTPDPTVSRQRKFLKLTTIFFNVSQSQWLIGSLIISFFLCSLQPTAVMCKCVITQTVSVVITCLYFYRTCLQSVSSSLCNSLCSLHIISTQLKYRETFFQSCSESFKTLFYYTCAQAHVCSCVCMCSVVGSYFESYQLIHTGRSRTTAKQPKGEI